MKRNDRMIQNCLRWNVFWIGWHILSDLEWILLLENIMTSWRLRLIKIFEVYKPIRDLYNIFKTSFDKIWKTSLKRCKKLRMLFGNFCEKRMAESLQLQTRLSSERKISSIFVKVNKLDHARTHINHILITLWK